MNKMAEEENWKEKYMEFQMLQQHSEKINEHVEMLNEKLGELEISINAVKELGDTKESTEILAPIANGIFFKASIKDAKNLIVNVGSDTTVERTNSEVILLLEAQQDDLREKLVEAEHVMQEIHKKMVKIYELINEAE